ncbi:MAG: apolipoprotein N-acyltransferase [Inquilinus sp.]|nr:apolipoprotein N-acyltransferase [Inquilinus sp.]
MSTRPVDAGARSPTGVGVRLAALAASLRRLSGWRRWAVAFGFGAVATLALPPVYATPLLLVAFPGLLWLLGGAHGARAAFAVGWWFGLGFFVTSLYWIAFALAVDLASFFWMIPFAVVGLPALLALFVGAATAVLGRLRLAGVPQVLAFAVLWALAEWLRGTLFTGFPWQLIGYGWGGWAGPLQAVSLIGVYGLGLLTVLTAALPVAAIRDDGRWSPAGLAAGALTLAVLVALGGWGAARLGGAGDETVPGVVLRLVQPNIDQRDKWDRDQLPHLFALHLELSRQPGPRQPTHIIWPETAVSWPLDGEPAIREAIASAVPPGGLIVTGAPRVEREPLRVWNSLSAIDETGAVVGTYDKFHLVPFGEYVPLRGILPIEKITPGRLDFSAGTGPRTLALPGLPPVSPLICYEVIFPGAVSAGGAEATRPAWLLNLTNDAWYGITAGPHQHFAIARTRAVEEGVPLVRVATTGISGVVDPYGRVTARLDLGRRGVVDADLPRALDGATPFARWGNGLFLLAIGGLALAALGSRLSRPTT